MMNLLKRVKAFAPATSANLAVGFDILGFAIEDLGDEVTLEKNSLGILKINSIMGNDNLPYDLKQNSATVALQAMLNYLNLEQGFNVSIKKYIPLSSGLGGSAASSVAALTALNRFLIQPLAVHQLVEFAMKGEEAACGTLHGDNVIPSLFGGMTLIQSLNPLCIIQLPLLPVHVVLMHPHIELETRASRAVLNQSISLELFVKQNARTAALISALYEKNYTRFATACVDEIIEPLRAPLIPLFYELKATAYHYGALACSISGSGPTLFAITKSRKKAQNIAIQMSKISKKNGIASDALVSSISSRGARVFDEQ